MAKLYDVIRYEGPPNVLVYRYPATDFPAGTQLIVHESQEAVFFRNGQMLDSYESGRYTLESEDFPYIGREFKWASGKKSPFHAEVYFVNKADCMTVLWGTPSPILIQDPEYDVILPIRANGQFTIRVDNARKLLVKLVGTMDQFDTDSLTHFFRGLLVSKITDYITYIMLAKKISFLQVQAFLSKIAEAIHKKLQPEFAEYGLLMPNFYINSINVPESDPSYQKIKSALAAAKEKELMARGKKKEMDILGYTYQQERTFDVLDKAAQNEGSASDLMGIGMGLGMGVPIGHTVANMGQNILNAGERRCPSCGASLPPNARFCLECGQRVADNTPSAGMVVCPHCGQQTPSGKFCLHCGQKLTKVCPDCGAEVSAGGRFCPECGHWF